MISQLFQKRFFACFDNGNTLEMKRTNHTIMNINCCILVFIPRKKEKDNSTLNELFDICLLF